MKREPSHVVRERFARARHRDLLKLSRELRGASNPAVQIQWNPPQYQPYLPFAALSFTLSTTAPGARLLNAVFVIYQLNGDVAQALQAWQPDPNVANVQMGAELVDTRWPSGSTGATVQAEVNGYVEQDGEAAPFSFPTQLTIQPGATPAGR